MKFKIITFLILSMLLSSCSIPFLGDSNEELTPIETEEAIIQTEQEVQVIDTVTDSEIDSLLEQLITD